MTFSSGFGTFDLESAYLARARMNDPYDGPDVLPMSVLLALMEREGVKLFASINRRVRNAATVAAAPLVWEAFDKFCATAGLVESDPADPNLFPPGQGGIQIQPGVIQIGPGNIQIVPGVAPAIPPVQPPQKEQPKREKPDDNFNAVGALQVQAQPARPAAAQKQPAIARVQPIGGIGGVEPPAPDQITLKAGKPGNEPT